MHTRVQALNETACGCRECDCAGLKASGRFLLVPAEYKDDTPAWLKPEALYRDASERLESPLIYAFKVGSPSKGEVPNSMPPLTNGTVACGIMTWQLLERSHDQDKVLVRLVAGDIPCTAELTNYVPAITSITQMSLTTNRCVQAHTRAHVCASLSLLVFLCLSLSSFVSILLHPPLTHTCHAMHWRRD